MGADLEAIRAELIVTRRVEIAEGRGFGVSGLPLAAIVAICRRHWEDCSTLFDQVIGKIGEAPGISLDQANWLGGAVVSAFPQVAAEIISECAGWGEEGADIAAALPMPVQLNALNQIAELTFTSEMPPKKVIEIVVKTLKGVGVTLIGSEPALAG